MSVRGRSWAAWVATAGGVGWIPKSPGTAGTLAGALAAWGLGTGWVLAAAAAGVAALALPALSRFEEERGAKDPSPAVIDEVVGYWVAVLALPRTWPVFLAAFACFRVLDIWKPFPARESQALPGGWGILVDDLIAALYTQGLVRGLLAWGALSP